MADLGLLSGIAEGLSAGMDSFWKTKNSLEDRRLKAEQVAKEEQRFQKQQEDKQKQLEFEQQKFMDESAYKKDVDSQKMSLDRDKLAQDKYLKELELKQKGRSEVSKTKEIAEQIAIPGLVKQQNYTPTRDDVKAVKEAKVARDDMLLSLDRLKKLNQQAKGAEIMPGPLKDQIVAERRNVILKQKNLETLGQLSQSDIALAEAVLASDPTALSARNILGALTGGRYGTSENEVAGSLGQAEESLKDRFANVIKTRGFLEPEAQKVASEDSVAVEWALSNPKDPRASAILKANGMQIGGR